MKDVDLVRAGSSEKVSEIDISNPKDLRAVMTGLFGTADSQAVTISFGVSDFAGKFKMLVDNFANGRRIPGGAVHRFTVFAASGRESRHQRGARP